MIAAGEVVQRPASVVKELMENAVDAGATQVDVVVTDSGRTLIQVIDNGSGMSPSDAVLCFERHATSKITSAADLERIVTYGFRGEALASIAAVSQVTLRTRRVEDETGTQVVIGGDGDVKTSSVSAPSGSNFAVRNLFYNTPARRKFLKSDQVEFKHIVEEFTRVAVPRPEIGFSLTHNGKQIYVLKPAKSLKFRILDLMGRTVVGEVVDIFADTAVVQVSGFIGRPESARRVPGNQYFFVGGRYFRSPYLHKAVMKAYEEFVPEGFTPAYFIFLEVDPQAVDVNIHPTKTEIKFEDDNVIFQVISACVREALGRNSFGASLDFNREGAVELPQLGQSFDEYKAGSLSPATPPDPDFNPVHSEFFHQGDGLGVACRCLLRRLAGRPVPVVEELLGTEGLIVAAVVWGGADFACSAVVAAHKGAVVDDADAGAGAECYAHQHFLGAVGTGSGPKGEAVGVVVYVYGDAEALLQHVLEVYFLPGRDVHSLVNYAALYGYARMALMAWPGISISGAMPASWSIVHCTRSVRLFLRKPLWT